MSEWQVLKLKTLTTKIGSGATPKGGQESYHDSGISLIRSQNVLDFEFSNDGLAFIDRDQAQKLSNVIVEDNDVLVNITGDSVARVCKVPSEVLPARVNQHVSIVRPDDKKVNSDFLLYFLLNPLFKKHLLRLASDGGTRNALTKADLEGLEICIPSLNEQKHIATVLSCLDRAISNLRRQNETLEAIAQTLFKYWFVDFEFPNADGKPYKSSGGAMRSSDLGEIPAGCRVGRLGDEVETLGGGTPSTKEPNYWVNGDILWYSPTDLTKSNTLFSLGSEKQITHLGLEKSSAKLFPAYSILLTSRATIGEITINTLPASTNQGFITLIPNEKFSVYFLHGWLLTQTRLIKQLASGSTFPELSKSSFRKFLFLIPNQIQLESYNKIIKPLFQRVENNIKQIQ